MHQLISIPCVHEILLMPQSTGKLPKIIKISINHRDINLKLLLKDLGRSLLCILLKVIMYIHFINIQSHLEHLDFPHIHSINSLRCNKIYLRIRMYLTINRSNQIECVIDKSKYVFIYMTDESTYTQDYNIGIGYIVIMLY